MRLVYSPRRRVEPSRTIITPRVRRAQRELVEALSESVKQANLSTVDEAEAKMSAVIADIWNEVELNTRGHILRDRSREYDQ